MPLNRQSPVPLYLQLYRQLRDDYDPQRSANQRLWPIRKMAQNLGVSKTTVEQAYEQLLAEGYVHTVPGSGYFYNDIKHWPQPTPAAVSASQPKLPVACQYDFRYGVTELLKPSWNAWKKAVREALRQAETGPTTVYPDAQGVWALREELVTFLKTSRGVHCTADQIVITNGSKAGLSLLLSILPRGIVGVENPGYRGLTSLAASYGHTTTAIPITTSGIDLSAVTRCDPAVVYTTPSHQFPLGYVLPIAKRLALLKWAADYQRLIIEDDYDSEYRYNAHPLPSLQSLATADQVAYLGTFSRGIDPTLRMGYLVLPKRLVASYHRLYQYRSGMVAGLLQQAMLNYFTSGAYYRHLSRSRAVNRQKYRLVCEQFAGTNCIHPITTGAGIHVVVRIPNVQRERLLTQLVKNSVRIYPLDSNWAGMPSHDYYLLGFAALDLGTLKTGLQRLIRVCEANAD
ncbi:PLP-dependent aminotransferase family protein [Lactiplantibacillus garii]|uniref:PLP-dependent aminotransferase family protein n=1 Tax=Lactiplantibacillus garii TaxID=2306423 RepID=A0A3R8KIR8_9LACO|nr:PLP-dependent aminotransferase family protein [Lactiplantibacillus garii]RRK10658.1 PLP-dependent aminotransferase family protein [Lactiplantibacillus garii]